jgi:HD-like signal output (HDOD) protein
MTSSIPAPGELVRPLADLSAWTAYFRGAEIPVLRETVDSLEALRPNEEQTDANSIGEMIGGDPLMTLKVFVHASAHRGRSVVTGAETVIAALVMMGIPPFFRAFTDQPAVEDRLAAIPEALEGLERVMRRAHRGARFALAFAVHRTDPHAATVHAAALLHEFAEMLLWCHAPRLALLIRQRQDADPALRSSVAQQSVLHIELAELQNALTQAWQLPSLLAEGAREPHAAHTGARTVALASRLARHTANGWDNPAVPDDVAEVATLLNLSPAAALHLVTQIDAE